MRTSDLFDPRARAIDQDPRLGRPSRVRYQVLVVACSLAVVTYIHRVGFATASTKLKDDLGLSAEQVSYLMAAFLVGYGGFEVPCGLVGDRVGVRHLVTLLVLGWSLMTGGLALVGILPATAAVQFVLLLALRFLFGVFQAGAFPALSRMMTDWMPVTERASAQGFIWMSSRLGGALAPLLLGSLIAQLHTWRTPLVIVAGLGVLWCAGFWPWFRNRPGEMGPVNAAERALIEAGRAARPAGHGPVPWARMLRSLSVWSLCLMYGFGGFVATFFITMLPVYLRDHRHLSVTATDWLTGLPLASGVVACVVGGMVSDGIIRRWGSRRWGRRLAGATGLALAGLALLGTIGVAAPWALAVLLSVTFFCNDLSMGPAWAACADIGERYAGTLGGAMNMIGNLAAALGSLVAGYLLHRGQPVLLFVIFACSFWLASVCWLGVDAATPLGESA